MPLSLKQLENVCQYRDFSKCCKYLVEDSDSSKNFHCLKLSKFKNEIDEQAYKDQLFGLNFDVSSNDNCAGLPITRFIDVGYDCT